MGAALFVVVRALLPRWDKGEETCLKIATGEHPELDALLREVAESMGEKMPASVYLSGELNASVEHRGGFLGIGGHRRMNVGVPLLQILNVSQFRSVLAHEFGHFQGGDTKLGAWIHKTRSALIRSVEALHEADSLLRFPFKWYCRAFLRLTFSISRQQEFAADRTAARVTGPGIAADALRAIHGNLYSAYWSREVSSLLERKFIPPIVAGFEIYRSARENEPRMESPGQAAHPYDTHPALAARLDALASLPQDPGPAEDTRSALALLNDPAPLEAKVFCEPGGGEFAPIRWEDATGKVFIPGWREAVDRYADIFAGVRAVEFASVSRERLMAKLRDVQPDLPASIREDAALRLTAGALGLALQAEGWTPEGRPGDPFWYHKDVRSFCPLAEVRSLWSGKTAPGEWRARVTEVPADAYMAQGLCTLAAVTPNSSAVTACQPSQIESV